MEGTVSFWNDASLKETVGKLQVPCNNTKSKKEFTCNVGFRDNEGNCMIKWDCSMSEWADEICPLDFQGLLFASTVPSNNRWFWIISMSLLAFSLTSDCCQHMMYLQRATFLFKIKIVLQIVIAMNVCFLNAILAAGQGNGFDILMNSMALMTLNDVDDIIA